MGILSRFVSSLKSTKDLVYVPRRFAGQPIGMKRKHDYYASPESMVRRGDVYPSRDEDKWEKKRKRVLQHDFIAE